MVDESNNDESNEEKQNQDEEVIDKDLHEEFTDEELLEMMQEARRETAKKEEVSRKKKQHQSRVSKWVIWLIALAMLFNIVALLPETFSIPAVKFLKASASLSTQSDIKQYKKAVVLIETPDGKGTGFAFNTEGKILTNHHVVENFDKVSIAFRDDGVFVGRVTETYPEIDLAIIELEGNEKQLPALELADNFKLKPEEEVYFIGNPLKFTGIANEGKVLDYVQVESKEKPVVMMDAPVYRGNSGSPVINKDGKVTGVIFATLFHDEEGRVGLFIPIDYFYKAQQ